MKTKYPFPYLYVFIGAGSSKFFEGFKYHHGKYIMYREGETEAGVESYFNTPTSGSPQSVIF